MSNTEQTNLGVMLRRLRVIDERTLRDVAAEIGIGHTTLSRIEKGETFDAETWLKLQVWLFKRRSNEALHDAQSTESREGLPTGV